MTVDTRLADERNRLTQRFDDGTLQEVAAELDQIRRPCLFADRQCLLAHRIEQWPAGIDRHGIASSDNEQLGRRGHVRAAEYRGGNVSLSGLRVRLRQTFGELDADRTHRDMDRAPRKTCDEAV